MDIGHAQTHLPHQEIEGDLCSFSLNLTVGNGISELVIQAAADAALWRRWLKHPNCNNLDILKNRDQNRVSSDETKLDCDVCTVGESLQLAQPKPVDQKVKLAFQLVFADLMGAITPDARGL